MNSQDFSKFRHESIHALERLNEANEKEFRIGSWSRYDYDLDRGTLTFSQDGVAKVVASILVAGTTSESGKTWLWSWGNGYLPDFVSEPVKKVRDFGAAESIVELAEPYVPDDEYVGWALTAIAANIVKAKGAYRCPGNNGFIYLLLTDIAFADLPAHPATKRKVSCSTHGPAYETFVCETSHGESRSAMVFRRTEQGKPLARFMVRGLQCLFPGGGRVERTKRKQNEA